jgi:hypothetical protein
VTSRRELLQWAAATTSLVGTGLLARVSSAAVARGHGQIPVELLVFDRRFPAAVAVASHMRATGVPAVGVGRDLTSLWYDSLDLRWQRAPMTLAGITTRGALFVLETLAADRGMRVLYRGEHRLLSDGRMSHVLTGPIERVAEPAFAQVAEWPAAVAAVLGSCSASDRPSACAWHTQPMNDDAARAEALHSWVIAPRSLVAAPV